MTPHFNASFRVSDFPPKSFQAPLPSAQPARMRRGHTAPRLRARPSSVSYRWRRRHLPLQGKARCLCRLPSTVINVLGALASRFPAPRGRGPERGAQGHGCSFWTARSELRRLPDARGPHCSAGGRPRRPAAARAPSPGPGLRAGARRDSRPWPLRDTQALVAA